MYKKPDFATRHIFNPLLQMGMRFGISFRGSQVLAVRGRKTGREYTTPVNPLSFEGARYLVAPRGETGWVKNIRASGVGELRLGSLREPIRVAEITDDDKVPILREYLKHWKSETSKFFGGLTDVSPDGDLRRAAPDHPVFRLEPLPL